MEKKDYYAILGVPATASSQDIRKAFRKIARDKDKNAGDKGAEERFIAATEAFDILIDPDKRAKYDRFLKSGTGISAGDAGFTNLGKSWRKPFVPHLVALLVFIVLSFIYCSPVLQGIIQGDKVTVGHNDMTQVQGMIQEAEDFYNRTGQHPLWSNSMFSGMPTYVTYTGPTSDLVMYVEKLVTLFLPYPVGLLFIAMLGFYLLMCVLDFKYWIRLFGAVAFGFSSFNVILISAGHVTEAFTLAYMAPVLAGVILTYRGRYLLGGILTLISTALMVYSNHLQIMYYTMIVIGCVVVATAIHSFREKQGLPFLKASIVLAIAAFLAILPSSDNLMVTKEFAKYSTRGSQSEITLRNKYNANQTNGGLDINYAFGWSMGKLESLSILVPDVYGGAPSESFTESSNLYSTLVAVGQSPPQAQSLASQIGGGFYYWGPQPGTTPIYYGVIVCFLFVLSFFLVKSWHKWWLLAAALIGFMLSWGKNFPTLNDFLFYHLPAYNKFRSPSMAMVIPQLVLVVMACWALQELVNSTQKKLLIWKAVRNAWIITAAIALVIASGMLTDFHGANDAQLQSMLGGNSPVVQRVINAVRDDRASLLHEDGLRSLVLILLAGILLWAYIKSKIKLGLFAGLISVLLIFDLFQVDKRYLNNNQFTDQDEQQSSFQPTPADQSILQDKDPYYRVLNLSNTSQGENSMFNESLTSYFFKSVGGYSPAKLWRYQDLIDFQIQPAIDHIYSILQGSGPKDSSILHIFSGSAILNMLNTKYFILNPSAGAIPNPLACGNAWFVRGIQWAPDANSEILSLTDLSPLDTVVIDKRFSGELNGFSPKKDSSSHILLTQYGLNELDYVSENSGDGFGVFSDIYYPAGWKAFIDGQPSPIFRVNYALRGLKIPSGKHQIVFRFHPDTFFTGEKISMYSSILLILVFLIGLYFGITEHQKEKSAMELS